MILLKLVGVRALQVFNTSASNHKSYQTTQIMVGVEIFKKNFKIDWSLIWDLMIAVPLNQGTADHSQNLGSKNRLSEKPRITGSM